MFFCCGKQDDSDSTQMSDTFKKHAEEYDKRREEKDQLKESNKKLPPVEINSTEDLPDEYKQILSDEGLDIATIKGDNIQVLTNILYFLYKRRFKVGQQTLEEDKIETIDQEDKTIEEVIVVDEEDKEDLSHLKKENPSSYYKYLTTEEQGGFGIVIKAKSLKTKEMVAIKRIPHKHKKDIKNNIDEIKYLYRMKGSSNVVEYYESFLWDDELFIVMEFLEGGTLVQALESSTKFGVGHIAYIARECLEALISIHSERLVHRDIKPHNIMLTTGGSVKIIDFGLCIDIDKTVNPKGMLGSPYWMAPEVVRKEPHSFMLDVYSLGMVIYELLLGKALKADYSPLYVMYKIGSGDGMGLDLIRQSPLELKDDDIYEFLEKILCHDVKKRPNPFTLLESEFLTKATSRSEMRNTISHIFLSKSLAMQGMFL